MQMRGVCRVACIFATASCLLAQGPRDCVPPKELDATGSRGAPAQTANIAGAWFARHGNSPCAVAPFESALRADPGAEEARYNLGLALREEWKLQRAARERDLVVKKAPGRSEPRLALAMVLEEMGDLGEAESQLRAAAQTNPRSASIQHQLGEVLRREKRYIAAAACVRRAVELEPDNASHSVLLAETLYDNGSAAKAIETLEKAVAAHPRSALAQSNLGTLYAREKRYDQSLGHFRTALGLDPTDGVTRLSLAKALIGLDRYADALPLLNEALQGSRSPETLCLRGMVYRGLADYEKAAQDLRAAAELRPDDYQTQYNLGFVLARTAQFEQARRHLEKARSLQADSHEAQFQLANVLRRLNQTDLAARELAEFERRKKQDQLGDMASTAAE